MKQVIATLVVLMLIIAGLGFYRGWFTVSNSRAVDGDKVNINLTVDEEKMKQDAEKAKEETRKLTGQVKERVRP